MNIQNEAKNTFYGTFQSPFTQYNFLISHNNANTKEKFCT